jgi:hypothetical protein
MMEDLENTIGQSHLEFAAPIIVPNLYDVSVTDIASSDLITIGRELNSAALSETTDNPHFPVRGILYGQGLRLFVPLIVRKNTKSIRVNFLFDTASPSTYLRKETFEALEFTDSTARGANVSIHGTQRTVYLSSNHFENVDLLGQNFMSAIRGVVCIDYSAAEIHIDTKK